MRIFLNFLFCFATFWNRHARHVLSFPWRNLARISSSRFWFLLKVLITPEGIKDAPAFDSVGLESFLSFCLPFDHFLGPCVSCALLVLTAFGVAAGDHQLALLLTSTNHQTRCSRAQSEQVVLESVVTWESLPSADVLESWALCKQGLGVWFPPAAHRQEGGPGCLLHDGPIVPGLRWIVTAGRVSSGRRRRASLAPRTLRNPRSYPWVRASIARADCELL